MAAHFGWPLKSQKCARTALSAGTLRKRSSRYRLSPLTCRRCRVSYEHRH
ncbi:hypothetical protein ACVXG9_28925 [Escherichia coli]